MLGASRKEESHNSDRRGCSPTSPAGQATAWSVNTGLCLLSGKCVSLSWALALFGSPDPSVLPMLPWRLIFSLGTLPAKTTKLCPSSFNPLSFFSHQHLEGANSEAICLLNRGNRYINYRAITKGCCACSGTMGMQKDRRCSICSILISI